MSFKLIALIALQHRPDHNISSAPPAGSISANGSKARDPNMLGTSASGALLIESGNQLTFDVGPVTS